MIMCTKGTTTLEIIQECLDEQKFWERKKVKFKIQSIKGPGVWEGTGEILQVAYYPDLDNKIYMIRNNTTGMRHMASPLDYYIDIEEIKDGEIGAD